MTVFFTLLAIGLVLLWFLLSPTFYRVGEFVINKFNNMFGEYEINNKDDKGE